jgi:hypothetical protein
MDAPPTAANAALFDQPHWRVIAQGFETEAWFNDGQAVGTGGIVNPQATRLPAGQVYYRFASSGSPSSQVGGGWWLDFENFALVRRFADQNGYRLREAARLMLALPYAWTRVDRLVRALLEQPLRAWTGAGKAVQAPQGGADRGTRWIPTQHVVVRQLYVPGLATPGPTGQPLHATVFRQPVQIDVLD